MTTEPTTTETNTAAAKLRERLPALPADALLDVLHPIGHAMKWAHPHHQRGRPRSRS